MRHVDIVVTERDAGGKVTGRWESIAAETSTIWDRLVINGDAEHVSRITSGGTLTTRKLKGEDMTNTKTSEAKERQAHAVARLREILPAGSEVATLVHHGRGETDWVECFTAIDGRVERISWYVAQACGYRLTGKGIPLGGGGYSKAHEVVDTLSRVLYGDNPRALAVNRLLG